MGHDLGEAARTGREREEHTRREEDEEDDGDEDIRIKTSHLYLGT